MVRESISHISSHHMHALIQNGLKTLSNNISGQAIWLPQCFWGYYDYVRVHMDQFGVRITTWVCSICTLYTYICNFSNHCTFSSSFRSTVLFVQLVAVAQI